MNIFTKHSENVSVNEYCLFLSTLIFKQHKDVQLLTDFFFHMMNYIGIYLITFFSIIKIPTFNENILK